MSWRAGRHGVWLDCNPAAGRASPGVLFCERITERAPSPAGTICRPTVNGPLTGGGIGVYGFFPALAARGVFAGAALRTGVQVPAGDLRPGRAGVQPALAGGAGRAGGPRGRGARGVVVPAPLRAGHLRGCSRRSCSACASRPSPSSCSACCARSSSIRAVEPQRNFLAVLVDDSRSMTIADDNATPRTAFIRDAFGESGRCAPRSPGASPSATSASPAATERAAGPVGGAFTGTRSNIGQALTRAAEELAGLPVSGIVLLTDGADTSRESLAETLRALRSAGLPVFAVGLGRESLARDVQLGRVDPPVSVLKGTTLVVDVVVAQTGYAGRTVPLVVEDEGQQLASQDVTLPADGEPATVRVRFTLAEAGPRVLHFRIPVLDGEQVTQNNQRDALVTVVGPAREDPLHRRPGALRDEVPAPGGGRRQEPAGRDAAAHRGAEVPAPRHRRRGGSGRRVPEDARGALRLSRDRARQHRGRRVHAGPAADDGGLRQPARRRPARAGRPPRLRRGRLRAARRWRRRCRSSSRRRRPPTRSSRR